ncbi:MAG: hypothetical protein MI717_09045 [Spirochaetales bacterium]|nr:hypothetical protein [Spirochaetales bacterium]
MKRIAHLFFILMLSFHLSALPVTLGEVEFGLEGFDGYQEGMLYLSTDELGSMVELHIAYRGFGLDSVKWTFPAGDLEQLRLASASAAWWRSQLLSMDVTQEVIRDTGTVTPSIEYTHGAEQWTLEPASHVLRFLRQGKDYALILTEASPGADTRKSGTKVLPVFTLHFQSTELPRLRDMLTEDFVQQRIDEYSTQKTAIEAILDSSAPAS